MLLQEFHGTPLQGISFIKQTIINPTKPTRWHLSCVSAFFVIRTSTFDEKTLFQTHTASKPTLFYSYHSSAKLTRDAALFPAFATIGWHCNRCKFYP